MLRVASLSVKYGFIEANKNVSFHIKKGEFVALIGANGAGKTTLLNTIFGLNNKSGGTIIFKDKEISGIPPHRRVSMGIVRCCHEGEGFSSMTVLENIEMGAYRIKKLHIKKRMDDVLALFPVLAQRGRQPGGLLSGGEQQMLAIARALISNPDLLLMDEPSMGLAPLVVKEVYDKLTHLKKTGTTIFLVEQKCHGSFKIC